MYLKLTTLHMRNGVNKVAVEIIWFNHKNNEERIIRKCSTLKANIN